MVKNETVLEEAQKLIYGDRQESYGSVTENFGRIAAGWSILLGVEVSARSVGHCMAWVKLCRDMNKPGLDNLVDCAGYMGCIEKLEKGL